MLPPGPGLLAFIQAVRTRGFLDAVEQAWRTHGDVFRVGLGARTLTFAMHPDAVQQVNVTGRKRYDKRASYDGVRDFLIGEGIAASTGDLWLRQRRLMAPFFTHSGIRVYADLMLRDTQRLAERWEDLADAGEEVEIAAEMTRVTASIILKAMFSTEAMASIHRMKDAVEIMTAFVSQRMTGLRVPLWVPTATNRRYIAARDYAHGTIAALIEERRASDPAGWPDDLLSRLMNARDEETGEAMSEALLRDESITVFFAGHETTARTMTFAWYALAAHPEAAARLHAELDRELGDGPVTVDALRRLPYTLQVVKEVLRLHPPIPFYVRDAVADDEIGGFTIPSGSAVMLSPYCTHRHPEIWADPEAFDPDRWSPEREAQRHRFAYHPFAAGPRTCLGNNFSLLESHLMLAVLARRFAPRLREGFTPRWEMQGVLSLGEGLPMVIARRAPRSFH
ncbi:MAG: cytochrome P450 [Alphaproteobacteria bacterium]|nr:cytochrome P450 [Alphaproteobacteria bacterium]